jgi:hypothetical protein
MTRLQLACNGYLEHCVELRKVGLDLGVLDAVDELLVVAPVQEGRRIDQSSHSRARGVYTGDSNLRGDPRLAYVSLAYIAGQMVR